MSRVSPTDEVSMDTRAARQIWQAALGELQLQITRANFNTWLKETEVVSYEDNLFVIGAPSTFAVEWLENRLHSLVKKTLTGVVGRTVDVRFIVHKPPPREPAAQFVPAPETGGEAPAAPASAPAHAAPAPVAAVAHSPRLNTRYTFASYVVGASNRLAHAAAVAAAERPGQAYNPLFIYGGVGLGKTHLLHAVGHVCVGRRLSVLYVSSETFTNEFINAIRERRNEEFRSKYRGVDVLLIDDIQFIAGKEQTQEEFFHTFNDLHSANRQIVVSSDRPPKSMALLEDRLRSRFEWGLIADIQPPDLETRVAILRNKAEAQPLPIPGEVLEYIARKAPDNIRELEGSLNRVVAFANLNHVRLTVEICAQALNEVLGNAGRRRAVSPEAIIEVVAKYYGLGADDLRGRKRDRDIAVPRQIAMHLMREETASSLGEIGQYLGGRDHTTVMHGCEKIGSEVQSNSRLRHEVLEIKDMLYAKKGQR